MRLLFEIGHLKTATPATVSRAGILFLNYADVGWNPWVYIPIQTCIISIAVTERYNLVIMTFSQALGLFSWNQSKSGQIKRNKISVLPWVKNWIAHQKKTSRRIVANRLAKRSCVRTQPLRERCRNGLRHKRIGYVSRVDQGQTTFVKDTIAGFSSILSSERKHWFYRLALPQENNAN